MAQNFTILSYHTVSDGNSSPTYLLGYALHTIEVGVSFPILDESVLYGQLITTSLTVKFRGRSLKVDDVIVDTGSSHTVISPDILEEIGVKYENGDTIYEAYGIGGTVWFYTKNISKLQLGSFTIKDVQVDVGMLPEGHHALLGLDILKDDLDK
ncbi:retropepsin-like aspartic protease [Virgibacillus sp. 179-BFC.A HS]|uniref:Retropepsin-like aspartic protease n=1 Tax=Tigheibacillus jepli TaxID=3035914 RepID=A0ABU5CD58_9BACI|nr:retropepsin-like aspartic protease [Virgibacillus sp. 179-BFC.A HS]MDY0404206.1 retropepsin-like aspartic protease [Virgibacillus sp. 179-BFC.A HS]